MKKPYKFSANLAYIIGTALLIASVVTNLIPPRVASAHHPELSGVVSCEVDGTQLVTWTIANWTGSPLDMKINASSVTSGSIDVAVNTVVPIGGSVEGHTSLPGSQTGTVTLSVTGLWDYANQSDVTATRTKSVTLGGTCAPPPPPPPPDYQLNLSHIYCYDGENEDLIGLVEIHFVLLDVPDGITPGTLTYTYGSISPGAHTGNVWHYTDYVPSGAYDVQSASVDVDGVTVSLHNPGAYAETYNCGTTEQGSASVAAGICTWDEQSGSQTAVTVTLNNASLTIGGVTYEASDTIYLAPGSYPYTWEANLGYEGSGSGTLVIGDCTPGDASAQVALGICTWEEQAGSLTLVTITLAGASFTIDGVTYIASQTISLAPGSYEYTWSALEGYKGSGSGTLVIGDCTPGNAAASVTTGICTWDDEDGSLTPVVIVLTGASLTIDGVTYTTSTSINLPPGSYDYSWSALEGYLGSGEGTLVIGECLPAPVPVASLTCYTLEFSSFKVVIGNSGPAAGVIGYSTDADATIVSLGEILSGGETEILVPLGATILYVYPEDSGGWGTPTELGLDVTRVPVCEKDPMGLTSFCSYVDLAQPHGWTVSNLNAFAVLFTWVYGSDSSAAPIALAAGASYSFTTVDHPSAVMQVFVDGILLASEEPESCPEFITLGLTGICSDNPEALHGWRATNTNDFEVTAEWRVNGSSLTGLLTIPAGSAALFTTPVSEGSIAQLYYGGVPQDNAGAAQGCVPPENPPENPPETPPVIIVPLTSVEPVLIPVTGFGDDVADMMPAGMFSLGLGFFGLGTILHGVSRRRKTEK